MCVYYEANTALLSQADRKKELALFSSRQPAAVAQLHLRFVLGLTRLVESRRGLTGNKTKAMKLNELVLDRREQV